MVLAGTAGFPSGSLAASTAGVAELDKPGTKRRYGNFKKTKVSLVADLHASH